ncbi:MAG TPA: hypothetical protein DC064_29310 [Cyanobacteria bacterium UBA9273]|nr:hypothetical protein [Cyanobacteria bacterium UBA9273]
MLERVRRDRLQEAITRYHQLVLQDHVQLSFDDQLFMQNFYCYRQMSFRTTAPSRENTLQERGL